MKKIISKSLILVFLFAVLPLRAALSTESADSNSKGQPLVLPDFTNPPNLKPQPSDAKIRQATAASVKSCTFLGSVTGKIIGGDGNRMNQYQLREELKKDAIKKALQLKGTDIVWGHSGTQLFYFKLPAEVYLCKPKQH